MSWTDKLTEDDRSKMAPDTKAVRLTLPSVVGVGEEFDLHLAAFRRDGFPHLESEVTVKFDNPWQPATTGDIRGLPKQVQLSPSDEGVMRIRDLSFPEPGVYAISAAVPELPRAWGEAPVGIVGSNPVWVVPEPRKRVYFGDIHVHSAMANCHRHTVKSPDFLFSFARDVTALDFAGAADHVEQLDPDKWEQYYRTAQRYNNPGRFLSILGYEYTHIRGPEPSGHAGHMNVYFSGDEPRDFRDISDDYHHFTETRRRHSIQEIWRYLDRFREKTGGDYVSAIHHPCWERHMPLQGQPGSFDDARMPFIEVWSKWGSSLSQDHPNRLWRSVGPESGYAHDALDRGYRVGFIASSDCHNTAPHGEMGHLEAFSGRHTFYEHGGLAGVWTEELTRRSVFDALRARRCFGTKWSRIPIDYTVNGAPMGSVVESADDGPRRIRATVLGTSPSMRVQLVRNGRTIRTVRPEPEHDFLFNVTFTDDDPLKETFQAPAEGAGLPNFTYYYVKVVQNNGAEAWASPVWLTE